MPKEMLGAKVSSRTLERLEKYADKEGISKSEATDRLLAEHLDIIDSNTKVVVTDGGQMVEQLDKIQQEQEQLRNELRSGPLLQLMNRFGGISIGFAVLGLMNLISMGLDQSILSPAWTVLLFTPILVFLTASLFVGLGVWTDE